MILKALYDLYHRLGTLPPPGTEEKEIAYVIVLDKDGNVRRIESKRAGKNRYGSFLVPKGVTRTSAPMPNNLWDNGKYVLGLEPAHEKYHKLFVERIKELADFSPFDPSLRALRLFYERPKEEQIAQLSKDPLFEEVKENLSVNMTFQLDGDDCLIAEKYDLIPEEEEDAEEDAPTGVCLITGESGPIVRLTTATPIPGNSPMAALVGFQVKSGYDSYGKDQAYNAPISPEAEFAYTSALKYLLRKDASTPNNNKIRIGDRVFLFWGTSPEAVAVEEALATLSDPGISKKDNPNEKIKQVEKLFKSIWSGEIKTLLDDRFYILGLAPNTGRIAVVAWGDMPLQEFAGNILRHFNDMDISSQYSVAGIFTMLAAVTISGKASEVPPKLVEEVVSAVWFGTHYPFALYTGALERIRAELPKKQVSAAPVAILKAYLNRRNKHNKTIQPLTPMLDKNSDYIGYLCGRLAAVLVKIQEDVKRGDSMRTRYLSAASTTPGAVFPAMLNVSIHHTENLTPQTRIFYEQLQQEIISKLPPEGFPAQLNMQEQGRFFVGYYQQREDLFTKREKEGKEEKKDKKED